MYRRGYVDEPPYFLYSTYMSTPIQPGNTMLHFNPSTGRIVRVVTVIKIQGDAAIVGAINGKSKGKTYPVSLNALHPSDAPE